MRDRLITDRASNLSQGGPAEKPFFEILGASNVLRRITERERVQGLRARRDTPPASGARGVATGTREGGP